MWFPHNDYGGPPVILYVLVIAAILLGIATLFLTVLGAYLP